MQVAPHPLNKDAIGPIRLAMAEINGAAGPVRGAAAINPACIPPVISALVDPPSMVAVDAPVIAAEDMEAGL